MPLPAPMVRGTSARANRHHRSPSPSGEDRTNSTATLECHEHQSIPSPPFIHLPPSQFQASAPQTPPKRRHRLSTSDWISPPRLTSPALFPVHSLSLASFEQEKFVGRDFTQVFSPYEEEDQEITSPAKEHVARTIRRRDSQFEQEDQRSPEWKARTGPPRSSRMEARKIGSPRPKIVRFNSKQEALSAEGKRFVERVVDNEGKRHKVKAAKKKMKEEQEEEE